MRRLVKWNVARRCVFTWFNGNSSSATAIPLRFVCGCTTTMMMRPSVVRLNGSRSNSDDPAPLPPGGKPQSPRSSSSTSNISSFAADLRLLRDIEEAEMLGSEMPPMLRQNEKLVDASLALLNAVGSMEGDSETTPEGTATIEALLEMVFSPTCNISLAEQYHRVCAVFRCEALRNHAGVAEAALTILEHCMPKPVYCAVRVLEGIVDGDSDGAEFERVALTPAQRQAADAFLDVILEGGIEENGLIETLSHIRSTAPQLLQCGTFIMLLRASKEVVLQCRLYSLILEACRSFDTEGTGKVRASELHETLVKVVGQEAADQMIHGCQTDANGSFYYSQFASILMKGSSIEPPHDE